MGFKRIYYGWVIAFIVFITLATHTISWSSFGIFLKPLTEEFNWERGVLSGTLSLSMLLGSSLAIFTGRLSDKYGPRLLLTTNGVLTAVAFFLLSRISSLWQVYLIWGALLGVAGSCCYTPAVSTIPRWFAEKRGIVLSIVIAGVGLGGIVTPLLAQWLISTYGWRQAYTVLGIITLLIITPLAQFMKHSPQQAGFKSYRENGTLEERQPLMSVATGLSFKQTIKTGQFWLLASVLACFFFFMQVILVHIAPHAMDIGVSPAIAASIVSIYAAGSLIGRLSVGFVSDKVGARLTLSMCLIVMTVALSWLLFSKNAWMLYVFATLFGLGAGGMLPLETILPAELFGIKSLGVILGSIILIDTGLGGALGPPLAGYTFDRTGSYTIIFIICLVICILALILSLILIRPKVKTF